MGLVEVLLASAVRHGPYPPWYTFRFGIFPIFLYIPLYSVGASMVVAYTGIYWNIGNIANMKPAGGRRGPWHKAEAKKNGPVDMDNPCRSAR